MRGICRDGCLAFQGRNRLQEGAGGVLVGGYGYLRLPAGSNLRADQRESAGANRIKGIFPVYLTGQAQMRAGCGAEL